MTSTMSPTHSGPTHSDSAAPVKPVGPARSGPTRSDSATPVKRSPRERLLDAAGELFYAEGVQSVGIDRVIERAGVAKASLYSTFGSKEELVRAYLDARHERMLGRLRAAAAGVEDPVERILAVFDAQASNFDRPDYRGCAFTAAASAAPRGGRIDEATESFRHDVHALFTELTAEAGAGDPEQLASQLQMIYDGGGVAANLDRNPGIAGPARAAARALVAAALAR
jgi:AcrR family transcriptional regulator